MNKIEIRFGAVTKISVSRAQWRDFQMLLDMALTGKFLPATVQDRS